MKKVIIILFLLVAGACAHAGEWYQDFESWPGPYGPITNLTHEGWIGTNCQVYSGAWALTGANSGSLSPFAADTPVAFISPKTTNGFVSISFDYANMGFAGQDTIILDIDLSTNMTGWQNIASITNTTPNPSATYSTNIVYKSLENSYVRIARQDPGANEFCFLDNITVKDSPVFFIFTNSIIVPTNTLVGTPVTAYLDILADPDVINTNVLFHFSTNNAPYESQIPSRVGNTYSGNIPAVSTVGSITRYYFSISYDIPAKSGITNYYPSAGPQGPLSFTNKVSYTDYSRNQDFEDWSDPTLPNHGWTGTNLYSIFFGAGFIDDSAFQYSAIISPLLTNGIGTLSWDVYNYFAGSFVYGVDISETLSPWVPIQSYVFTNTALGIGNEDQVAAVFNYDKDVYARIYRISATAQLPGFDNIVASYPSAFVVITNVTRTPGYMYVTNEVNVTCDIYSSNPYIPADNYKPKVVYTFDDGSTWVTNDMAHVSGTQYQSSPPIPAKHTKGDVGYYILCEFDGYFYSNAIVNLNRSPAFSPDTFPASNHVYNVRPFRSSYGSLSMTSSLGVTSMELTDDYTWQILIDFTESPKTNLNFRLMGLGQFTNGAFSTATNFWEGDSSPFEINVPRTITTVLGGGFDITAKGSFSSPVVFRLNTDTRVCTVLRGFYQDFNKWNTADVDYYDYSIAGIGIKSITNNFDSWDLSTHTNSIEGLGDASGGYFDDMTKWTTPSSYANIALYGANWRIHQGKLVSQRPADNETQQAIVLRPITSGGACIYPSENNINGFRGLGTFSFKYRASNLDTYYIIRDHESFDWSSVAVDFGFSVNKRENDASVEIIAAYDKATGDGYKARYYNRLSKVGYTDGNDLYYDAEMINGTTTNSIRNDDEIDNNETIGDVGGGDFTVFGFMMDRSLPDKHNFLPIDRYGRFNMNANDRGVLNASGAITTHDIAIGIQNLDIDIDWFRVRPARYHEHNRGAYGTDLLVDTAQWFRYLCTGSSFSNQASFIVSPNLPFSTAGGSMQLYVDANGTSNYLTDVTIYGSNDRSVNYTTGTPNGSGVTPITNIVYNDSGGHYMYDIPISGNHTYIWVCENAPHTRTSDRENVNWITIFGPADVYETFTTAAESNNWSQSANGGWTYRSGGDHWNHDGYNGDPVRFGVEISDLDPSSFIDPVWPGSWTTVYTNTADDFQWSGIVTIDFDTLDPFIPHAEPIVPRIVNYNDSTTQDGHLIVDEINFSDWRGKTVGTAGSGRVKEAWIQPTGGGGRHVELARDRAYIDVWGTNHYQYVESAISSNGISAISFSYYVTDAPVTFDILCNSATNLSLPDSDWTNAAYHIASFTNNSNSTDWDVKSVRITREGEQVVRIVNTSTNNKGTLLIDDFIVSDFAGVTSTTWVANNVLITHKDDDKEFDKTTSTEFKTCYMNLDDTSGTLTVQSPPESYVETPYSANGIGNVSFWYRHHANSGSPPGAIEFYAADDRYENTVDWNYIGGIYNITSAEYQYFTTNFYFPAYTGYNYLRIVNGTNGIATGRVCIDNILIQEPMGATIILTNLTTIPEYPVFGEKVKIAVEVSSDVLSPTDLNLTAYYRDGVGSWATWGPGSHSGSPLTMTNSSGAGNIGVYISEQTIDTRNIDDVVQFAVHATFTGENANSPITYRNRSLPYWYTPIDLCVTNNKMSAHYYTFSCPTSSVWINEYNVYDGDYFPDYETNQFIELCGKANADISDWKIEILNSSTNKKYEYKITNSPSLNMNPTNGFGFWFIGDDLHSADRRQALTNTLYGDDGFRLVRSMGAWVDLKMGEFEDDFLEIQASIARKGIDGSYEPDFTWGVYTDGTWSPGYANNAQSFIDAFGSNPYVNIEIIDMWRSGNQTYIVYDIIGTNYIDPPTPLYSTNIADTSSWQIVTSPTNSSMYAYPTWQNTYTSWWTTVSSPGGIFHKLSITNLY